MAFTFIHTADWQLGKPFRSVEPRVAALLAEARLDCIATISEVAKSRGAAHVLVAGDVFDSEGPSERTITQALDRLAAARDVTWHLLPGNHDPARPGGLWERLALRLPRNVVIYPVPGTSEIAAGIHLLACPLTTRLQSDDPTAWLDDAVTPSGALRIGLAHGSVRDFASGGEAAAIIDPTRAARAQLDYLALGDWHGVARINGRVWYCGTPEPDRYPSNEPGFVLAVTLSHPGSEPQVERIATARYTWVEQAATINAPGDLDDLEQRLLRTAAMPGRLLARVRLAGRVTSALHAEVEQRIGVLGERILHLDADLDDLVIDLDTLAVDARSLGEELAGVITALRQEAASPDPRQAEVARDALAMLLRLVGESREAAL